MIVGRGTNHARKVALKMPRARANTRAAHAPGAGRAGRLGDLALQLSRVPQPLLILPTTLRRQARREARESLVHAATSLLPEMVPPESRSDKPG